MNNTLSHHIIQTHLTKNAPAATLKTALETAVDNKISLNGIQLKRCNLSCATLDTAQMANADFSFSNLNHANLSEAVLAGSDFTSASLIGTCLAQSDLSGCNFHYCDFGATDISGAILDNTLFSALSTLQLPFRLARSMRNCAFLTASGEKITFSTPPIVLHGFLSAPIAIIGQHLLIGHRHYKLSVRHIEKIRRIAQSKVDKLAKFS
ncbi:MAG: pentapeptide repeat-containing protein [Alphaproteobacteria bacterium]